MTGPLALLLMFAASTGLVAAYLLSGLDDRLLDTRRDLDTLDRLPRARAAWRRLQEGER